MIKKYGVKDILNNEYLIRSGRGSAFIFYTNGFGKDINKMTLYSTRGPATKFVNEFNKALTRPNSYTTSKIVKRELAVVEIIVSLSEV